MNIGNFGSFFEIFAGLNLAYISIEAIFNYAINKKILTTKDENFFRNQFAEIINTEINMSRLSSNPTVITVEDVQTDIQKILDHVKDFGIFPIGFQPAFLISALFCIFILLSYGFECTFADLNFTAGFVITINLIILIKSFIKKFCDRFKNKLIWIPLILVAFLINIILIYSRSNFCSDALVKCFVNDSQMAVISCVAGASSFIFYFLRVFIYNYRLIHSTKTILEKISTNTTFQIFDLSNGERYVESSNTSYWHKFKQYLRNIKNAYERLEQIKLEENRFENLVLVDRFLQERFEEISLSEE